MVALPERFGLYHGNSRKSVHDIRAGESFALGGDLLRTVGV